MRYHWARGGDVNAFFGLMLDNAAVMVLLLALVSSSKPVEQQAAEGRVYFTPGFVVTRMIPGTALGVLLGDLVYTLMAFRLARRTAFPAGASTTLKTPTSTSTTTPTCQAKSMARAWSGPNLS